MSETLWSDYVSSVLKEADCIKRAAIIGYPDAALLARSADFNASDEELRQIAHQFSNKGTPRIVRFEGVPFLVNGDETHITGSKHPVYFYAVRSTKDVVIVVTENEGFKKQPGLVAAKKVACLLREQGL